MKTYLSKTKQMDMFSANEIKQKTGEAAAALIRNGMTAGIGTGTTAYWLLVSLGKRVAEGLSVTCVPTSRETARIAKENNIPLAELNEVDHIDVTIDGADEIDPQFQLIKGGGGALLQEKMVAAASREMIVIADHTKLVNQLGAFPLPIEVIPFGWKQVQKHIAQRYPIDMVLREREGKIFVTDHGHYILDGHFKQITDAPALHQFLNNIPGVVDNGLFINMATSILIGYPDGRIESTSKE